MSEFQVAQAAWSRTLLRSLAACAVEHFVVSPGSRSTPLVAALQSLGLPFDVVIDERGAAFYALGHAKRTGLPSVVVCTSGSAPAHYFPALVEADESLTPLIVLSADRPPELQGNRSAQTIEQRHLFGAKVRWADDLGVPDATEPCLSALRRKAAQAVAASRFPRPGPVHLNVPLRKPLEPTGTPSAAEIAVAASAPPRHFPPNLEPSAEALTALRELATGARRPLIVAGPLPPTAAPSRERLLRFARKTGWPLLLEATSNLRFGGCGADVAFIDGFDTVFRALGSAPTARERLMPDLVLCLGDTPTSTSLLELVRGVPKALLGSGIPSDPSNDVALFVQGDVERTLDALESALPQPDAGFRTHLLRANTLAWELAQALSAPKAPDTTQVPGAEHFDNEGQCMRVLGEGLRPGELLVVGNSLPVRLIDTFVPGAAAGFTVLSQRGANGIDGLIASAAGAARAQGGPTFLVLGDISFLHDVGSLGLLAQLAPHLVVVVFNNQGGRLFEQLPVARLTEPTALGPWLTPHSFDLSGISAAFGIPSVRVGTAPELEAALELGRKTVGPRVIEVQVAPSGTLAAYQALQSRLATALSAEAWAAP